MFPSICLLLLSAILIYFSCELFVNGIEWLGSKLKLGATATGSVLAAFGTALPESAITFMAVAFGVTEKEKDIGVGAALGGPLVLATIAYSIVGLTLFLKQRSQKKTDYLVKANYQRLSRDQISFLAIFVFKVGLGLFMFSFKPWLGAFFLLAYALYLFREIRSSETAPEEEVLEPLKFSRYGNSSSMGWVIFQLFSALLVITAASHLFLDQITFISEALGIAPHMTALFLSPIATELPEIMNAVIWVRQGKERLALANISGSMMIQATIPSALGIFFTSWMFDGPLIAAALVTALAIGLLWFLFKSGRVDSRKLAKVGLLYAVFVGYIVWQFN